MQRNWHPSVTEIRRSRTGRPSVSAAGTSATAITAPHRPGNPGLAELLSRSLVRLPAGGLAARELGLQACDPRAQALNLRPTCVTVWFAAAITVRCPGFVGDYEACASGSIIAWLSFISQAFSYSIGGMLPHAE